MINNFMVIVSFHLQMAQVTHGSVIYKSNLALQYFNF